jgi:hypothetical protein
VNLNSRLQISYAAGTNDLHLHQILMKGANYTRNKRADRADNGFVSDKNVQLLPSTREL